MSTILVTVVESIPMTYGQYGAEPDVECVEGIEHPDHLAVIAEVAGEPDAFTCDLAGCGSAIGYVLDEPEEGGARLYFTEFAVVTWPGHTPVAVCEECNPLAVMIDLPASTRLPAAEPAST